MPHPLEQRVQAVRRRAVRWVHIHGLSLLAMALTAILVVFAAADYILRLQDQGARWILSVMTLAAIGLACWRLYIPVWQYRPGLVKIARRIEQVFPQLHQRLSSAIDFLAQDESDQTAGSAELRRAVVAETEARAHNLDLRLAIDPGRPQWVCFLAGCLLVSVLMGTMAVDEGRSATLALSRLAMPWSDAAWPRRNTLAFVRRPDKIAAGDDFEVELVDRSGRLPDNVQIQLRWATGTGTRTESKDMKALADRMIFRLDNVREPLAYRARGGDDDSMPWTELSVIEPPKVAALEISVTPPPYTGLPRQAGGRVVKAIAGSALAIRGRVDKPIVSARLRSESPGVPLPAVRIAAGGLGFFVPERSDEAWLIEKSASYWVELADASGLPTGRDTRWEVQSIPDSPPAIAWETPGEHSFVTPRALVAIRGLVKDDLAVHRIQLRYLRPGMSDQGEQIVDLYVGPEQAAPMSAAEAGHSRAIDVPWDLSKLAGLVPGDVLAVRVTAEDYKPQLATSVARRLTIITDEELESRLGQRQTSILGQMAEALRIQRECRQQLAALMIRLTEKGQLDASDLNHLQSAQLNQRQVEKLLGASSEGVEGQIVALVDELAANRVESQAAKDRMTDLLGKVRQLNSEPLVDISRQLTEAFKTIRESMGGCPADDPAPAIQAAAAGQDVVIQSLEGLLGTLTEWDSFSRLAREIGQIRGEQERVAESTETLRLAVVAESLSLDDRVAARQLRQNELELARRLDKIQGRMEQMLGRLQSTDPVAAGTLADALAAGRRLAIGGRMRDAAEKLGQFQFGQSHRSQTEVLDGLRQLLDLLSSRREGELARTIKSLRGAAGEMAGLIGRQNAVQVELDGAATDTDISEQKRRLQRLTKQLEALAEEAQQQGRKLQRLRAPQAATAAQQAGEQDAAAGQSASQGDADEAQQRSRQAQRRLEEAQLEIQRAIAQAEQELAQQQLARMEQWIGGLAARQKNVVSETTRLDELRSASAGGQLTAALQETLRNLAAEQRLIADETEQLQVKMAEQSAFALALSGARQEMVRAATLLARGETGAAPQQAAQSAATRLEQMLAALKPDEGEPPVASPPTGPPSPSPMGGQKDPFSSLAALKLLQLLQHHVSGRTAELERVRQTTGQLTDQQSQELEALADEQGRLADMVFNLIRESVSRPEDDPESLLKEPER